MDFTTGSFVLVGAALLIVILACYAKGKNYLQFSNLINPILTSLSAVLHAVGAVVKDNSALAIMSSVVSGAIDAAGYAEKLWLDGEIDKEKRREKMSKQALRQLKVRAQEAEKAVGAEAAEVKIEHFSAAQILRDLSCCRGGIERETETVCKIIGRAGGDISNGHFGMSSSQTCQHLVECAVAAAT